MRMILVTLVLLAGCSAEIKRPSPAQEADMVCYRADGHLICETEEA